MTEKNAESHCGNCVHSKFGKTIRCWDDTLRCWDDEEGDIYVCPIWVCDEYESAMKRGVRQVRKL
jgi:hypothetical protein